MWAAVPLMPVVVILPLIDWSAATVIVPLPVALVVTGGTSWPPLSTTLVSTAEATLTPIARMVTIMPSIAQSVRLIVCLLSIPAEHTPSCNLRAPTTVPKARLARVTLAPRGLGAKRSRARGREARGIPTHACGTVASNGLVIVTRIRHQELAIEAAHDVQVADPRARRRVVL